MSWGGNAALRGVKTQNRNSTCRKESIGIHIARGGGGRGDDKHIDGDFHGLHGKGEQVERPVSPRADGHEDQHQNGTDFTALT